MVWSNPPVSVSNSLLTAAYLNTYLRDNLLQFMSEKAATAGNTFSVAGVNDIRVVTESTDVINTSQTTGSTTYTDLATVGPTVSLTTATVAFCLITGELTGSGSGSAYISVDISGATSLGPDDSRALINQGTNTKQFSINIPFSGLTSGSNTFRLKYRSSTGTSTFANRQLTVISF